MKKNSDDRLTTKTYWDATYRVPRSHELCVEGFRNFMNYKIFSLLQEEIFPGKRVIEIGAGDSLWLPFLARRYPDTSFSGLDYSETGCERLRARSSGLGVNVICEDFLQDEVEIADKFDLLVSFGVVEHFESLEKVLKAMSKYLVPTGRVFTLIPNMSGLLGRLTRRFNDSVYQIHNPHRLEEFVAGHVAAGFKVTAAGYLGSTNFGVLSAAVNPLSWGARQTYLWLSRTSKIIHYFEEKVVDLPATQFFSPYIYCIGTYEEYR